MLEFSLLSSSPQKTTETCSPEVAYHRGYARRGTYPENSVISLEAAVKSGINKIEVDVSIESNNIFVGHDLSEKNFSYETLLSHFKNKFQLLIIDIKEVKEYSKETIDQLLQATKSFEKVIFIGRKCDLLYELSQQGATVSCEAMGVLAHQMLNWDWWSVNYKNIGTRYQRLLSFLPKKIIAWTLPTMDSSSICSISPEIVLVEQ